MKPARARNCNGPSQAWRRRLCGRARRGSCACSRSLIGSSSLCRRDCSRLKAESKMPYQGGQRLTTTEQASKLGHLEVVNSPFVRNLVDQFEYPPTADVEPGKDIWREFSPV